MSPAGPARPTGAAGPARPTGAAGPARPTGAAGPARFTEVAGPARRWPGILSRALAALLGGYGLAAAVAVCNALAWPGGRADGTLIGMMAGLVVMAGSALWAFAAASALRAWLGILVPLAVAGGFVLLLQGRWP